MFEKNCHSRFSAAFTMTLLVGMLVQSPTVAQNMVADPSFENNALTTFAAVLNNFAGNQGIWGAEAATITSTQGSVTPFDGVKMLRMTDDGLTYTQVVQAIDVTVSAALIDGGNAGFYLSARLNADSQVSTATLLMRVAFYTGPGLSFANGLIQNSPITLDNDVSTWEQFSVSGDIPTNTRWLVTQVAYLDSSIGTNAGYVDSVSLGITGTFTNRTAWQAAISGNSTLCEDFEAEPNATGWSTFSMPYSTAGGVTIDRLGGGTGQQFVKIGYNGTQTPHIRDFTAGITWNPGNAFTAFGFDYRTAHEQWQIEIQVGGSPVAIATLSPWTEGFLGLVLPAPSLATITLRGGLSGGAQGGISLDNMCFALDSPPPCAPCPPAGASNSSSYLITGNASGTDWSWKLEQVSGAGKFCAQDPCVMGVAPVDDVDGDGFSGTAADVATRFANSINDYSAANGCFFGLSALVQPILPPIPPLIPIGAKLFVFYETAPAPTLFVGACADPTCAVLFNVPSSGCAFNPLIHKIVPSGLDCNGNGEDDVIDILLGTSQDTNQDRVPDECQAIAFGLVHSPLGAATLTVDSGTGNLTIDNIGSSGLDGVFVDLGQVGNAGISLSGLDQYVSPTAVLTIIGDVNGVANQTVGTLMMQKAGDWTMTPDFSAVGATSFEYLIYMGPQVVQTIPAGPNSFLMGPGPGDLDIRPVANAPGVWPCDPCPLCGSAPCAPGFYPAYCIDTGGCCCVSWLEVRVGDPYGAAVAISVFDGTNWTNTAGTGFGIAVSPQVSSTTPLSLSHLDLRLTDAPSISVTEERIGFAQQVMVALGAAQVRADASGTQITNIGASGLDGVAMKMPDGAGTASLTVDVPGNGLPGGAGVAFDLEQYCGCCTIPNVGCSPWATTPQSCYNTTGSWSSWSWGSLCSGSQCLPALPIDCTLAAHIGISGIGVTSLSFNPDFSDYGASIYDATVLLNGTVVASAQGLTGSVAQSDNMWPISLGGSGNTFTANWTGGPVTIALSGQTSVLGDELRIMPNNAASVPAYFTSIAVRASNVDLIAITSARSVPVPDCTRGDVNADGVVDGLDIGAFVQGVLGAPTPEEICAGDFSGNGSLDVPDVAGFVSSLLPM